MENSNFFVPAQEFFPTAPKAGKAILLFTASENKNRFEQEVDIHNARELQNTSLDVNGFTLIKNETKVQNFYDNQEITQIYYKEITNILKKVTGGKDVFIFGLTYRCNNDEERNKLKEKHFPVLKSAKVVHNDFTDWSGVEEIKIIFPSEKESLLNRDFSIIHTWQPLNDVTSDPLAIVDATTVDHKNLVTNRQITTDRINETYNLDYNINQKWYYYPNMSTDEMLLFKGYDSKTDGRTRFTPHGSFSNLNVGNPRNSIETRCFVFS